MTNRLHLSCAETAKLVRAALKRAFPATTFSVRSSVYSLGASITVRWTDGPTAKRVKAIAEQYSGADFDGSIDLKCHYDHWLCPDGSAVVAHGYGTEGSRGIYPAVNNAAPCEGAVRVSFGADYVFCERNVSPALEAKAAQQVADYFGIPVPPKVDWYRIHPGSSGNYGRNFQDCVYRALGDASEFAR